VKRRLFNVAALVSLVLCALTVLVWVVSFWVQPGVLQVWPQRLWSLGVTRGSVFFHEVRQPPGGSGTFGPPWARRFVLTRPPHRFTAPNALTDEWRFAGFEYLRRSPPLTFRRLTVPCWFLALATAVAPALWYRRYRTRRARDLTSRCLACGYDLTGNVSGVCPECGTTVHGGAAA